MIQGTRTFRAPAAGIGIRQHASLGNEPLSVNLLRSMAVVLLVAVAVSFGMSQLFHWRISHETATLEQLQSVRRDVGSRNISLLAARAGLMSKDHVEAVVGVRMQLYRPENTQLHRL
jgi:hypothetical protein